jgi:hypothetical protein
LLFYVDLNVLQCHSIIDEVYVAMVQPSQSPPGAMPVAPPPPQAMDPQVLQQLAALSTASPAGSPPASPLPGMSGSDSFTPSAASQPPAENTGTSTPAGSPSTASGATPGNTAQYQQNPAGIILDPAAKPIASGNTKWYAATAIGAAALGLFLWKRGNPKQALEAGKKAFSEFKTAKDPLLKHGEKATHEAVNNDAITLQQHLPALKAHPNVTPEQTGAIDELDQSIGKLLETAPDNEQSVVNPAHLKTLKEKTQHTFSQLSKHPDFAG